jgi:hypothetical protein
LLPRLIRHELSLFGNVSSLLLLQPQVLLGGHHCLFDHILVFERLAPSATKRREAEHKFKKRHQ